MKYLHIENQDYGDLLPFIENENVTDINWNGKALWLDDIEKGRYAVETKLDIDFVSVFCQKISNSVNESFNKYEPLLEAETSKLRISVVHDSVTNTGTSISIRKTPPVRRITTQSIKDGFCEPDLDDFLKACVQSNLSIIICGLPGAGKTEYIKYLTQYINPQQRVITIEDNLELRYSSINPTHDCIEMKVDDDFTYRQAIKTSLRQRPDWILLSEARGQEVQYLLESSSIGTGCITSLHASCVESIPERILNMLDEPTNEKENMIYSFFDIGVLVHRNCKDQKVTREIKEVCIFDRTNKENQTIMIYKNKHFVNRKIPMQLYQKMKMNHIENPLTKRKESMK